MTILYVTLGVITWVAFGLIGGGFMFANMQGKFPALAKDDVRRDVGEACIFAIFGPIAAITGLFLSEFGRYGWWVWFKKSNVRKKVFVEEPTGYGVIDWMDMRDGDLALVGRPDCFEFAMDFLGDPEAPIVREYVERLEAEIKHLRAGYERLKNSS